MIQGNITTPSKLPRRGWLGALAAAVAGLALGKTRGRRPGKALLGTSGSPQTGSVKGSRASIAIHPCPDSVKRHG